MFWLLPLNHFYFYENCVYGVLCKLHTSPPSIILYKWHAVSLQSWNTHCDVFIYFFAGGGGGRMANMIPPHPLLYSRELELDELLWMTFPLLPYLPHRSQDRPLFESREQHERDLWDLSLVSSGEERQTQVGSHSCIYHSRLLNRRLTDMLAVRNTTNLSNPSFLSRKPLLANAENFTVYIKNSIRFPKFKFSK